MFITDWYNLYGSLTNFLIHKLTHVIVGAAISAICVVIGHPLIGLVIVLVVGIGKEIADHEQLLQDPTNPADALEYHVLDVIVTVAGGMLPILVSYLI